MDGFDLRRLDLNLVLALNALLDERSVSGAAQRLGVSQPAASKSLLKLRRHFGDELLRRRGRGYELTPLAATILPETGDLVHRLGALMAPTPGFEPTRTGRRFTLASSDYVSVVMGADLIRTLRRRAPDASVDLVALDERPVYEQLVDIDGAVVPPGLDPRLQNHVPLLSDSWCCVVDLEIVDIARAWLRDEFDRQTYAAMAFRGLVPAQAALERAGVDVRVGATTTTFSGVPFMVAGTDLVGLTGRRLAHQVAHASGTAVLEHPWAPLPTSLHLYFDARRAQDPGTRWFLDLVEEVGATIERRRE